MLPFEENCQLQFAVGEREERKVWSQPTLQVLYVESESSHSLHSLPVSVFNFIVQSKSLPTEVNDLNIELHLLLEVK